VFEFFIVDEHEGKGNKCCVSANQDEHSIHFNCFVLSFCTIFFCLLEYFLSTFCLETKGGAPARTYQRKILNCVMVRYGRAKFKAIFDAVYFLFRKSLGQKSPFRTFPFMNTFG